MARGLRSRSMCMGRSVSGDVLNPKMARVFETERTTTKRRAQSSVSLQCDACDASSFAPAKPGADLTKFAQTRYAAAGTHPATVNGTQPTARRTPRAPNAPAPAPSKQRQTTTLTIDS